MSGLARILLVFGLLVLGATVLVLWQDDRTANVGNPASGPGDPRVGRSTLSHGGAGVGGSSGAPGLPMKPAQNVISEHSPQATKR
jgi:hypothetical protein